MIHHQSLGLDIALAGVEDNRQRDGNRAVAVFNMMRRYERYMENLARTKVETLSVLGHVFRIVGSHTGWRYKAFENLSFAEALIPCPGTSEYFLGTDAYQTERVSAPRRISGEL